MLRPFRLERYFASREHRALHHLSPSDCEPLTVDELLGLAGEEAARALHDLPLGYTESPGSQALREAVAAQYHGVDASSILVAAPQECIFLAMHALLSPGDRVVVLSPAYQSLHEIPRSIGCEVVYWPVHQRGGSWGVDLDELAHRLDEGIRIVVVNSPHNPTGLVISAEERRELIDLLRRRGITLFSDEMYLGLEYEPGVPRTSILEEYENTIALGGLSKSYGLPGLRIGWLTVRNRDLLNDMTTLKDYTTICSSAPSEILATMALNHREEIVDRNLELVRGNLEIARAAFVNRPETLILPEGAGGSVLLPSFAGDVDASRAAEELMEGHLLLMVPGELFDMPKSSFRLGLGRRGMEEALRIFLRHLDDRGTV